MNKVDLVTEKELKIIRAVIRGLNAKQKIIETNHSKVAMNEVMNINLHDLKEAQNHPLWAQEPITPMITPQKQKNMCKIVCLSR